MLHDFPVCFQWVSIANGISVQHTRDMDENENLFKSLFGTNNRIRNVALSLAKAASEIAAAKKINPHLPCDVPHPSGIKDVALDLLRECEFHRIPPPKELIEALGFREERPRRRAERQFPLDKVLRIKIETGLKGRALARECRDRGLAVADRTLATYEKSGRLPVPQ
jgi:hypothetical protein